MKLEQILKREERIEKKEKDDWKRKKVKDGASGQSFSEYTEKKGKFNYLSWSYAVRELLKVCPTATWEVHTFDGADGTKQPYMKGKKYRVMGNLNNTTTIMNNTFWIGVFPGLTTKQLDFMTDQIKNSFKSQ